MNRPFLCLSQAELERARSLHKPLNSLHEGYAVILEELDEFKAEVWKKRSERNMVKILRELVQVAAMAQRLAEDVINDVDTWEAVDIDDALPPGYDAAVTGGKDGAS